MAKAVQKRSQMVKGSVWTANKKIGVQWYNHSDYQWVDNVPGPGRTLNTTVFHFVDLEPGDEITILGKASNYKPVTYDHGIFIPIGHKRNGVDMGSNFYVDYSHLKDHIDLTTAVKQSLFYVYNPTLDKYLLLYSYPDYDWKNPPEDTRLDLTWTDKLTKAKKHKMLHQSRQYMLGFAGYFSGMEFEGDYIAEGIATGRPAKDVPKDLIIREFDKITKVMLNEYPLQPWLDYMFKLRPLTIKYGSAVRSAFKEITDKSLTMSTMLLMKDKDDDGTGQYEPTEPVRRLKAQFKDTKPKRGSYVMKSSNTSVAIAFADLDDALVFRLQLTTDLDVTLVDANDLTEIAA